MTDRAIVELMERLHRLEQNKQLLHARVEQAEAEIHTLRVSHRAMIKTFREFESLLSPADRMEVRNRQQEHIAAASYSLQRDVEKLVEDDRQDTSPLT